MPHRLALPLVALIVVLAVPSILHAQTCTGSVPFGPDTSGFRAGASFGFGSDVTGIAAQVGGGNQSVFGNATVGRIIYDELDFSTTAFGGSIGGQVAADAARRIVLCPIFSVIREFANDIDGSGIDVASNDFRGTIAVGIIAAETPTFQAIPVVAVSIGRVMVTFDDGFDELTDSDTIGLAQFGIGLVLNRTVAITPAVSIAFTGDDTSTSFSLGVQFGPRRR
jgi:hypothetical protein